VERKYCFSESELREIDKVFYLHDLYKAQNERLTKNNAVLKKEVEKEKRKNKNALALNITTILALIVLLLELPFSLRILRLTHWGCFFLLYL
jgi:hypothetical protein